MRKALLLSISLLVMMSMLFSACAPAATPVAEAPAATEAPAAAAATEVPAVEPTAVPEVAAEGPVKIVVFSPQGTDVDLATNSFTKEAEKMFNIAFEWQTTTYDGNSAKEQRQISLASGDYPDLYLLIPWVDQFSQTDLLRYGDQGVVITLNDLIAEYAPNITAALEKYPYFKAMTYAPDGNIYGIPQLIECYHCSYPNKMWVNTKWMDQLGITTPATTAEFKAMLEAFKTKDPNGNGKADEVPLSGSIEEYGVRVIPYLMNGFIYDDDSTYLLLDKEGKVSFAANQMQWKEGLSYIKSLYDGGLIDPGAFTQNAEAFKAIGSNAEAELLGVGAGMHPAIFTPIGGDQYGADYNAIPALVGPYSHYSTYNYPSSPGATFVLTNKASKETQISAIKLVDYMFAQEGQLRAHFGEEGKDWRRPQDGDVANESSAQPIFATIPLATDEKPHNSSWGAIAQYFQPKTFRDGWIQSMEVYEWAGYERRLQDATNLMAKDGPETPYPHWAVWIDPAKADEAALTRQNITDYVNQSSLEFVTGVKSLDTDWDAYVQGLEDLGLTTYIQIMQDAYTSSFSK